MRKLQLILLLFFSSFLSAQQLQINDVVYGSVTSTMYKEAKLKVAVTPQEFHDLTLAYPDLKIFFANRMDYQDCMLGYGNVVRWELTDEETRNLKNFIKRNGGKLPKYRPVKKPIEPIAAIKPINEGVERIEENSQIVESEPTNTLSVDNRSIATFDKESNASEKEELERLEKSIVPEPVTTEEEESPVIQISDEELPEPLNSKSSREVYVTPPMKYENLRLTMNGERLPLYKAKRLARISDSDALRHFRKASRIRGWNYFWAFYAGFAFTEAQYDQTAGVVGAIMTSAVVFREVLRNKELEEAVFEYNSVLPSYE